MSETEISQQFCVRWNAHLSSLSGAFPQVRIFKLKKNFLIKKKTVFPKLLNQQRFIDVTLACEGQQVHCHKMVLAACSQYFDSLLTENPCKHPIIILPKDIKFWTVQALVEFMYKGQVNVSQAGLPDLVKTGDLLQIRGLCNTDITAGLNPGLQTIDSSGSSGGVKKAKVDSTSKVDVKSNQNSEDEGEKNDKEGNKTALKQL